MIGSKLEKKLLLDNFEGPLDLLLHLIKSKKMDVLEISLIKVVDQYIDFVYSQQNIDLDETSDYLLLASQLIDMKSKHLLKSDLFSSKIEEFQNEKDNLLERLIAYEKYKVLSENLIKVYEESPRFEKLDDDLFSYIQLDAERKKKIINYGSEDLKIALSNILDKLNNNSTKQKTLRVKRLSTEQIHAILLKEIEKGDTTYLSLIRDNDHYYYAAISLLIILEMSKNGEILLTQKSDFNDIEIRRLYA